jgi:coenzyme F420-0:L-glutamate ligase/coenzyme F420-1:gamma-L-glutamate ligase
VIEVAAKLEAFALPGIPVVQPGDDLAALIRAAMQRAELAPRAGDVLVVASKIVSRAEDRFVDLERIEPSARAREVGARIGKDARLVELILRESVEISREAANVLIVRHRLGFVVANAGVDQSNASGRVILLPQDPDATAARLRSELGIAVVISDSFGRPFRLGTVGTAIGSAGLPPVADLRGRRDLSGRALEQTFTAFADQIAAVGDLVAGQADEGRGAVLVRGLRFPSSDDGAAALCRRPADDLYATPHLGPGWGSGGAVPAPPRSDLAGNSGSGFLEEE